MRIPFILICFLLSCALGIAQLDIDPDTSVETIIADHLAGPGITISQVYVNGTSASGIHSQCGLFDSFNSNVGIDQGVIFSTGHVSGATGPNSEPAHTSPTSSADNYVDTDLEALTFLSTQDAIVIEFDFIPQGDTLAFRFVFASDEYPEFSTSIYNDVFGFFLSGPGIDGPFSSPSAYPDGAINLALLPDTQIPISVNSVNNGDDDQGPCVNCDQLWSNAIGDDPNAVQFDGLLLPITIKYPVTCGETYHMKLALADVGDDEIDSAVFIEGESFQTDAAYSMSLAESPMWQAAGETLVEGCNELAVHVSRSSMWSFSDQVTMQYGGSATMGVDYSTLPSSLEFNATTSLHQLMIEASDDLYTEGQESISIILGHEVCNASIQDSLETILISDPPTPLSLEYEVSSEDCLSPVTIDTEASGGLGYYGYLWSTGDTTQHITVENGQTPYLILSDTCAAPLVTVIDYEVESVSPLIASIPEHISVECGPETVIISPVVSGGSGGLSYEWSSEEDVLSDSLVLDYYCDESQSLQLTLVDGCGQELILQTALTYQPYTVPQIDITGPPMLCKQGEELRVTAECNGGVLPMQYLWSTGDVGEEVLLVSADQDLMIEVQVTDGCGLSYSATEEIQFSDIRADFLVNELEHFNFETLDLSTSNPGAITSYQWAIDGEHVSTHQLLQMDFIHEDAHQIGLKIENEYGCTDETILSFQPGPQVYIPSAFSPDGDLVNDRFGVSVLAVDEFHLRIFDRRGTMVFETVDPEEHWSGLPEVDGEEFATSYYFYHVTISGKNGSLEDFKGTISTLR